MENKIMREVLIGRIKQELCHSSILFIVAPNGYGKSEAVSQYLQSIHTPVVKIDLQTDLFEIDQVHDILDKPIIEAFEMGNVKSSTYRDDDSTKKHQRNKGENTVVIDHYEHMKCKDYVSEYAKKMLAGKLPYRLIIISCGNTYFPVKELVDKKLASIITADDLAFSPEEVDELSRLYKRSLSALEKEYLSEILRGCPQLVREYFDNPLSFGQKSIQTLWNKVFNEQDSLTVNNLVILCALHSFEYSEACQLIGVEATDKAIELGMIFDNYLSYDDKRRQYVFAESMILAAEKMSIDKVNAQKLIDILLLRMDYAAAATLAAKYVGRDEVLKIMNIPGAYHNYIVNSSLIAGVVGAFEQWERYAYPYAYLRYVYKKIVVENDLRYADEFTKFQEQVSEYCRNPESDACQRASQYLPKGMDMQLLNINIQPMIWMRICGDTDAIKMAEYISAESPKTDLKSINWCYFFQYPIYNRLNYISWFYHKIGFYSEIVNKMIEARSTMKEIFGQCGYLWELISGEYAMLIGDIDKATNIFQKLLFKALRLNMQSMIIIVNFELGRIHIATGNRSEAIKVLRRLETINDLMPSNIDLLKCAICYLKSYLGAELRLVDIGYYRRDYNLNTDFYYTILTLRELIRHERYMECYAESEMASERLELRRQYGLITELSVQESIAYYMDAQFELAKQKLIYAINTGEKDGIMFTFIENRVAITPILESITDGINNKEFLLRIKATLQKYAKSTTSLDNVVRLSDKERQVLFLMDKGLLRKQIASQLFISTETVKSHIANIYKKLNVNAKSDAISLAKSLGII